MNYLHKCLISGMVLSLLVTACGKKNAEESSDSFTVDSTEASIESAITVVSGVVDDQNGSSFAKAESYKPFFLNLIQPTAVASACGRAVSNVCSSGVKSQIYSSCNPNALVSIDGEVELTYSQSNCSMSSVGDQVVRTYDLTFSGPRGGSISHTSDVQTDYRGTSYGGGGVLTKETSGYEVDILGRHTQLSYRGTTYVDASVRTLSPLVINQLSRNGRIWSSGQIEVNHNLAQFTSVIQASNIQWSSSCCHPVSGTLSVTFSGSKSGSASVTFNSCGSGTINENGQTKDFSISYCE